MQARAVEGSVNAVPMCIAVTCEKWLMDTSMLVLTVSSYR